MSWTEIKDALHAMRPTGQAGFEGLTARLLQNLLGTPFVVARSGSQPSGDAISYSGHIHLQTKRYAENTPIDENSLEGEINNALREVPNLEVYVIAATRTTAQLRPRLQKIEQETGIDIIQLELTDHLSDFGALCVAFWNVIETFPGLDGLASRISSWVSCIKDTPDVEVHVSTLRKKICTSMNTFIDIKNKSKDWLSRRFGLLDADGRRFSYLIKLTEAVPRHIKAPR